VPNSVSCCFFFPLALLNDQYSRILPLLLTLFSVLRRIKFPNLVVDLRGPASSPTQHPPLRLPRVPACVLEAKPRVLFPLVPPSPSLTVNHSGTPSLKRRTIHLFPFPLGLPPLACYGSGTRFFTYQCLRLLTATQLLASSSLMKPDF